MEVIVRMSGSQGEREERVRVARAGDVYEVTVGERTYRVDHAPAGGALHSLRIDGGEHHEVAVRRLPQGEGTAYWVTGAGTSGPVEVTDPLTHLARQAQGSKGGRRPQRVLAYMPGRVVAILVEEGQEVASGQGVVVLEAMKMQNEIQAEHDGRVARVFVQPGQAVEGGDPLFEME